MKDYGTFVSLWYLLHKPMQTYQNTCVIDLSINKESSTYS